MSDPINPQDAVRSFAEFTTMAMQRIGCSYADAAVFILKFGPLLVLMQDAQFQAQLARFNAAGPPTTDDVAAMMPQAKGVQ